ncbi:hypothetical protein H696_04914 [Fonticula alba]|uniref:Peptidase S54 rhomboid domain-containing protein n=1 Tax=Fonticula alba TaxID=691883 RepID=A0A058Z3X6_FONAL|nr:hypothetical protein H696_04914 [Fonticula alba]KCV68623.1 hypothetical protein H696_04914 [Fonticula alba]|eukprot:XP_009497055.1 hypothetical protein H696_04914 [Fonticula alba]
MSSLHRAPLTKGIVGVLVIVGLVSRVLELRPYLDFILVPNVLGWWQLWRLVTYVLVFEHSGDAVLAIPLILLTLPDLERRMGSRSLANYLLSFFIYTTMLQLFSLAFLSTFGYKRAAFGPHAILMAAHALYYSRIPVLHRSRPFGPTGPAFSAPSVRLVLFLFLVFLGPDRLVAMAFGLIVGTVLASGVTTRHVFSDLGPIGPLVGFLAEMTLELLNSLKNDLTGNGFGVETYRHDAAHRLLAGPASGPKDRGLIRVPDAVASACLRMHGHTC